MTDPAAEFSVIVPTLDEAGQIVPVLESAREALGPDAELIVADGGSADDTVALAGDLARVVVAAGGRGSQLNAGARRARGRILVFLHADTRLVPGADAAIRGALSLPGTVGGCFRFSVDPPAGSQLRYRLLEWGVNLRTRWFRTATGDQAIFARRDAFDAVGGLPEIPLFEDVGFVRALRRIGRFAPVDLPALTSRRRWEEEGYVRTVVAHWLLRAGYLARISPARLARWYGHPAAVRRRPPEAPDAVSAPGSARR